LCLSTSFLKRVSLRVFICAWSEFGGASFFNC